MEIATINLRICSRKKQQNNDNTNFFFLFSVIADYSSSIDTARKMTVKNE